MSDYTKTTNFAVKDSLATGDVNKLVKGTEIDTEYTNIATAVATKANTASPTFTGTVTIPTLAVTGALNAAQGSDIASAGTLNLDTATGNLVDVTGTTTITAITLSQGRERTVRFTGALTLTNGASLVLPGGANITTAAGDFAIFAGYAAGVVRCVSYVKAAQAPVSFAPITNALAADVALNNTANYFDGPSVAQGTSGTWFVVASVLVSNPGVASTCDAKLWDGTTVIGSLRFTIASTPTLGWFTLSGYITAPAGNLRVSVKCTTSTAAVIAANVSGNGKDSVISAIRIA